MIHFLVISIAIFVAFFLGVWLAPVVRADYGKLKSAEQAAKDKL